MSAAVELVNVTKDYGRVRAVDHLTLAIPEGSLFGLIGPNGAGKTTTFALLSGFLRPTEGEIKVRGQVLAPGRPPVGRILSLPQDASLPMNKKVLSALVFLGRLGGLSTDDATSLSTQALARVGLSDLADRKVSQLSHGQRRRVGIAQTLVGKDEVIVLDEPTAGLDPRTTVELRELIKELHTDRTIVLSSHNLEEMELICTHAGILDKGKLVEHGSMQQILGTGGLFTIVLAGPAADAAAMQSALAAIEGVERVEVGTDKDRFEVHCTSRDGVQDLTNEALKVVLQLGGSVSSVDRGQSLTERFMQATGGKQ